MGARGLQELLVMAPRITQCFALTCSYPILMALLKQGNGPEVSQLGTKRWDEDLGFPFQEHLAYRCRSVAPWQLTALS